MGESPAVNTKKPANWAQEFLHAQEVIFSVCMGLAAYAGRHNPLMSYPDALFAFAAFMCFNLLYHRLLRRSDNWVVSLVSIAANSLFITLILGFTGGEDSYFWPLFLLPIFTACMHLEKRHVLLAALVPIGFLSYFSLEALWRGDPLELTGLAVKVLVLAFSAGVTMQVSFKERTTRAALEDSRGRLDQLARAAAEGARTQRQKESLDTLSQAVGGILHHLNTQLTVIHSSAELLAHDLPLESSRRRDLDRVVLAARSGARMLGDLLGWLKADTVFVETDLGQILAHVLVLFDHQVLERRIRLDKDFPDTFPPMKLSPSHVHQALLSLLYRASKPLKAGDRLRLAARPVDGGVDIRVLTQAAGPDDPTPDLESVLRTFAQHGGTLKARSLPDGAEVLAHLPSR